MPLHSTGHLKTGGVYERQNIQDQLIPLFGTQPAHESHSQFAISRISPSTTTHKMSCATAIGRKKMSSHFNKGLVSKKLKKNLR